MKKIPLYSLVIFPTPEQANIVKSYKQTLRNAIGWFGSANAAAHITVMNFDDDAALNLHLEVIRRFCKAAIPKAIACKDFDTFGDRTFFISPDKDSMQYLNQLIRDFQLALGVALKVQAHMSIARGLDADKMKIAYALFKNNIVNFQFVCDAFYLRKFNGNTRQYSDIIEKFELEGRPSQDLFSGS